MFPARLRRIALDACVIVVTTLVLLAALELVARVASLAKRALFPNHSPTILKQPWGAQYLKDQERLSFQHASYVEFRERPLVSPTISIDQSGRREVPGNCMRPDAFKVLTFGGSTMFGYGVSDQYTIPAYLTKLLGKSRDCVRITNYGAGAWVSSQGVVQLLDLLRRGERPDAVVFYEGINDVYMGLSGDTEPGEISPDQKLRLKYALEEQTLAYSLARNSVLVRVLRSRLIGPLLGGRAYLDLSEREYVQRTAAVAAGYSQSVRAVDAMAKAYGFDAYFFLQPWPIIVRKPLTAEEKILIQGRHELWLAEAKTVARFYESIRGDEYLRKHPRFFDLSAALDGVAGELFADDCHLLPEGNRIIAEHIASRMTPH